MNRSISGIGSVGSGSQSAIKMKSEVERSLQSGRGLQFGRLYLKNREYDNALNCVNSYLNARPDSSDGYKLLAEIYEAMGSEEKAVSNYKKALDLKRGITENNSSLNQMTPNRVMCSSMLNDSNSITNNHWSPLEKSTPERTVNNSNTVFDGNHSKQHSCGTCSNQSLIDKMCVQQESLVATNKLLLDLLKQNNLNVKQIQKQLVDMNDNINTLTDSQNSLKETFYEYMTQEDEQDYDEYSSDKEETANSSCVLPANTSSLSDWKSPTIETNASFNPNKPLSEMFKPAANSWACDVCYVQNDGLVVKCVACETPKLGSTPKQTSTVGVSKLFGTENVEPISFQPTFTSSTSGFKFGTFNSNSSLASNSIFSNTTFKFGNTCSPQPLPTLNLNQSDFGFPFNKPIEDKSTINMFSNDTTDSKPIPFSFGLSPKFGFSLNNTTAQECLQNDVQTNAVNETVNVEEENTSLSDSQVEPSNADSIYFQPVVPLPPKVEVKTGEEEESVLFVSRARLFRFNDGEWKERGVGDLKILESQDSNRIRLVMRRDTILKVCLNQYITKDLKLELKDDKKSISWSAIDYSEEIPNPEIFLLRLKNAENAELFMNAFISAQSKLEVNQTPNKTCVNSDQLNNKPTNDLAKQSLNLPSNPQSDDDIEVVWVKAPESEEILRKVKELKLPLNFYDYENMEPCKGCRGCSDDDYSFNTDSKLTINDNPNTENVDSENLFHSAIAATNVSQTAWTSSNNLKSWTTATPVPVFSTENNTGDDDDCVAPNPDIYFKPLIALPDLVEVHTGEEDEESIYCQRAKLYRFDPDLKEWKERGVGEFKILKHKSKNRYRMLLRRDQILKIACNHYITSAMTLKPMNTSETAICWHAVDYSDGQPSNEQFALKVKNKDLLKEFIKLFEECQHNIENGEIYNSDDDNDDLDAQEDTDAEEDQQN